MSTRKPSNNLKPVVCVLMAWAFLLTACGQPGTPVPQTVRETVVVQQTVIVQGTPQIVEKVVTPTPPPKAAPVARPMVLCSSSEAVTMDPHSSDYAYSTVVQVGPYEALLQWAKQSDGTWVPGPSLAKSWEVSSDGLEYTFHLQPGVKFSDGTPFNAEAVKWNFERLGTLGLQPSSKVYKVKDLKVTAVDDQTVRITLPDPYAPFLYQLIQDPKMISPTAAGAHKAAGKYGDNGDYAQAWLNENAVGTGPYLLKEWKHGESATLVKNPSYWQGWSGNHLESVVVRLVGEAATRKLMLKGGDCDIAWDLSNTDIPDLQASPNVKTWERPGIDTVSIQIRPRGPFADKRVRQAVALAFDYEGFANNVLLGHAKPANSPLVPVEYGWDSSLPSFKRDLNQARKLMAEAGYPNGLPGEYEDWILPNFQWFLRSEAELFKANLADIGINVKIMEFGEPAPWLAGVFDADVNKQPTFFAWNWGGRTGAADSNLRDMYYSKNKPPAGMNGTFYSNPQVDQLLDQGKAEPDPAKQAAIYKQIQKLLLQDQPMVWLVYQNTYYYYNKDLNGFESPPLQEWVFTSYYDMSLGAASE